MGDVGTIGLDIAKASFAPSFSEKVPNLTRSLRVLSQS